MPSAVSIGAPNNQGSAFPVAPILESAARGSGCRLIRDRFLRGLVAPMPDFRKWSVLEHRAPSNQVGALCAGGRLMSILGRLRRGADYSAGSAVWGRPRCADFREWRAH